MSRFNPTPSLGGAPGAGGEGTRVSSLDTQAQGEARVVTIGGVPMTPEEIEWMQLARTSFNQSTDWVKSNHYSQWERNIHNFNSKHPPGSKYRTSRYKNRNRGFRPMTRMVMRKLEETYLRSVMNASSRARIKAQDPDNETQAAAAKLIEALLNERMEHSIPWYPLNVGVVHDAQQYGFCVTHQCWEYEENNMHPELPGRVDKPVCELVPPENIRFDEAASWMDPLNDSPFVIQMIPMFAMDIVERGEVESTLPGEEGEEHTSDRTGQPLWRKVTLEEVTAAFKAQDDSIARSRHTSGQDPKVDGAGADLSVYGYNVGWVHRNIFRKDGEDWLFYSVGTTLILSDVVPLRDAYPWLRYGERPYAFGSMMLEAHKAIPASPVEMGQSIQASANDVANRRQDNVELAMDKRYFLRRGANIDRNALYSSVPGSSVETDDPNQDVRIEETKDVTSSAYAEQDRLNMDMDELFGAFSNATVMANRKQNETVGGMEMQNSNADGQADLYVQALQQTWYRRVISQLIRLEQYYETDLRIMTVAAKRAGVWMQVNTDNDGDAQDALTKLLINQELTVNIETGISALSPSHRINMLMTGVHNLAKFPGLQRRINEEAVAHEIFSALGFGDGARFLLPREEGEPSEAERELQARLDKLESGIALEELRSASRERIARTNASVKLAELEDDVVAKQVDSLIRAERNEIDLAELDLTRIQMVMDALERKRAHLVEEQQLLTEATAMVEAEDTPKDEESR